MASSAFKDIYKIKLFELYQEANQELIGEIAELVTPESQTIAEHFYRRFLNYEYALKFLSHDDVKFRLQSKMTEWINGLFKMKHGEDEINDYIDVQLQVGSIHSRIGLPISLVAYGMTIIKDNITILLINSDFSREKLSLAVLLMNGLVDTAHALINESYIGDTVNSEKNAQSFRLHITDHNLAFDCERLRTSLLDWLRRVLLALHQSIQDLESVPNIQQSEFGLWITHKGNLILANRIELEGLMQCIQDIDQVMQKLIECKRTEQPFSYQMNQLSENISKATWLLGNVAKEISEIDSGRDVLTKLFNRRYLDTIMRHETDYSTKQGLRFGVVYVDIDFFKKINDQYGHENGDYVLSQLAEALLEQVRSSDFVFRMGGEEFLIVLSDLNLKSLHNIAEKIRVYIEGHRFMLTDHHSINITVSIGIALHDGHPDYHRTMNLADEALYRSKHQGRNQVNCLQS